MPSVTRVYQNHHLDSTRWAGFEPRDGDVIVTTSYKAGTTLTQTILMSLVCGQVDLNSLEQTSPWIDARPVPVPLEDIYADLESRTERRFLKSHLALDGLPYFDNVHYLVVARDPRDVFMSFANHYGNYNDTAYELFNEGAVGDPLPRCTEDIHELWRDWISRGWFEWETEGYPFWGNLHHIQTYWNYRHLPNLHFLHYADMRADLEGTVRRIADCINFPVTDEDIARVTAEADFDAMKQRAIDVDKSPDPEMPQVFTGGLTSFIYKGTNGRWKDVLSESELAMYEAAKSRVLTPDCAEWLETGGEVSRR